MAFQTDTFQNDAFQTEIPIVAFQADAFQSNAFQIIEGGKAYILMFTGQIIFAYEILKDTGTMVILKTGRFLKKIGDKFYTKI